MTRMERVRGQAFGGVRESLRRHTAQHPRWPFPLHPPHAISPSVLDASLGPHRSPTAMNLTGPSSPDWGKGGVPPKNPGADDRTLLCGMARSPIRRLVHWFVTRISTWFAPVRSAPVTSA